MSTRPNIITRKQELPLKDDSSTLFLKVMISIAVFLFAVTLAGVLSINSMLLNWNQSILGSLTVQIMPVNNINKEKALEETLDHQTRAVRFLEGRSEIEKVTPLQDEQLEQLIKPWLGDGVNIKDLPVPRLIDVRLKKNAEVDFIELAEKLAEVSPQASLDNHKLWLNKLIKFADGLKMMALSVFAAGCRGHFGSNILFDQDQSGTAPAYYRNPAPDGRQRRLRCTAICPPHRTARFCGRRHRADFRHPLNLCHFKAGRAD